MLNPRQTSTNCCCILVLLALIGRQVLSKDLKTASLELRFFECESMNNYMRKVEHPDSCNDIVTCVGNNPVESTCPRSNQAFNQLLQRCVDKFSEQDTCTVRNADRECRLISQTKESKQPQFIPHYTNCHRYYNCSSAEQHHRFSPFQIHEMECPYPDYWDIEKKRCLHYSKVTCGDRHAPSWVCEYLSFNCEGPNCRPCYIHHPSCAGKDNGHWPNPIFQWSPYYVECKGERPTSTEQKKCPVESISKTEQVFHPYSRTCVPLWVVPKEVGGLEPVCGKAPPGYYQLEELDVITYSCPGEMIFYCELPYPGHRDIRRCEMMVEKSHKCNDGLWPSFSKLWSKFYVECQNGKYSEEELACPQKAGYTQLFHPVHRKCLSPWYIVREKGGAKPSCDSMDPGDHDIEGYPGVKYRCPGMLLLYCKDDRRTGILNDIEEIGFYHDAPIVYSVDYNVDMTCHYINDHSIDANDMCSSDEIALLDVGVDASIPIEGNLWTPYYVTCTKTYRFETMSTETVGGLTFCDMTNGIEHVFHPKKKECVPRWQLSPENGGFIAQCDCKRNGLYSIGSYAYKCPEEETFICNPPMHSTTRSPKCSLIGQ